MIEKLKIAEQKALQIFNEAELRKYFVAGQLESELNEKLFYLADEMFSIKKFWHKRIVRSGANTLLPYKENPIDLMIQENDILFFDFGPVLEEWEADLGRTYVIGNDETKLKIRNDVEEAWHIGKVYFDEHRKNITCANFYNFTKTLAHKMGWEFGNEHCGHLIGNFPHEQILGDEIGNYFHHANHSKIIDTDILGNERYWIYEIHFIDKKKNIGGFFEQLVS
jgi:Xaa-Pro aminopeptidase